MMFQKAWPWRGLAILLVICLLIGAFPVGAVEPTGDTPLYFVDAGGSGAGAPCSLGSYQSTWDQAYGLDSAAGKTWGYVGEANAYEGNTYFDSVRVDEQDTPGKGITYKFQLEPGFYLVEVGMKEYWQNSGRKTDIRLQGKTVETEIIPYEYENGAIVTAVTALAQGETALTVEIVRSADNSGSNEDPLVSYIRIDRQEEGYTSFTGVAGRPFYDTDGKQIQAHGGQIQQLTVNGETKYYWIGEDKTNDYSPVEGVHVYSSTDLYNWTDEGLVLKTMSSVEDIENDEYFKALYGDLTSEERAEIFSSLDRNSSVIERPKMLYNETTGKYVMWFHADNGSYSKAQAGVAISDSPTGPFQLLGTYDLNYVKDMDQGFDGDSNHFGAVRDMNLFQDDDGTAYIIYSSQGNQTLFISKLNADYTGLATDPASAVRGVDFEIAFAGQSREAPAMFKYNGMYYLVTSGCTGWDPNQAQYAVAETPFGPWTVKGNPCQGDDADVTFSTQSTCVFPVDAEAGKFIYMGDRWNKNDLSESRYVWLPVEFQTGNNMVLKPYSDWTLSELDGKGTVSLVTNLNRCYDSLTALKTSLPNAVTVKFNGQTYENQAVTWSEIPTSIYMGDYTVTGTISGGALDGKTVGKTVTIADSRTVYFFDCGAEESAYFNRVKEAAHDLKNQSPNPAFDEATGVGYVGTVGDDGTVKFHDGSTIFDTGIYAMNGGDIIYKMADVDAGLYTITAGYRDWWAKYTDYRGMRLLVTDSEGNVLASDDVTLRDDDIYQPVSFFLAEPEDITVTIEKTGGSDQVLSFLSLVKTGELPDGSGEDTPLASFHLISDVHVSSENSENAIAYAQGMRVMDILNSDTTIAFVNAGDFTNNSQESEYQAFYNLTKRYNPVTAEQTLIIQGNHDVRGNSNWCEDPNGSFPQWEKYKGYYQKYNADYMPETAQDTLYHAKELGGYTFLMLNTELGLKDAMYMSEEQLAWFEAQMKASYEEDPTKPVFIVCHQALNDTHMRSNVLNGFDGINTDGTPNENYTGADAKVKEIMAKYPVGVFLSGHIHNGLGYGEAIAREYGVCVDLPAFGGSENGCLDKGTGYEVMIYEDRIEFQAYNFATGERLSQYDKVVEFPTVSALYQKASTLLEDETLPDLQRTALQQAVDQAKPLLNRVYNQSGRAWDDASEPEEFYYHADAWVKIDEAAQALQKALQSERSYTITVTGREGGSIEPGTMDIKEGENATFTITPADGYKILGVLVDGKSVGAVESYTFTEVTSDHTITAYFENTPAAEPQEFMDCFRPMPIVSGLTTDIWGAAEVGARDPGNGLEDPYVGVTGAEGTRYCYWDGAILKDEETGTYYMFASRWNESDGHGGWPGSQAVYATSDNLYGPYEDQGLMWPDVEGGYGHNVFPFELKEGEMWNGKEMRYGVVLGDTNRGNLQGGIFVSDSLAGPWNFVGKMQVTQPEKMKDEETDNYFHLSNISIVLTPEDTYIAINREGDIATANSVFGPWTVVNQNIWSQIPGLSGYGDVEDPVMWYSNGLYHCVVNRWDAKHAFYLTSENGIDQWRVHDGSAYRPDADFLRYEDGTVNRWTKLERPNVYIEDGEVKAMTLSVIDVEKEVEYGNDSHGSKVIVIPFDNDALKTLRDCPSEILDRQGISASADTGVQTWREEAGKNYGDRKYVRVMNNTSGGAFGQDVTGGGSPDCKIGYVRFDLGDAALGSVEQAQLSLVYYKNFSNDVETGKIRVALADTNWNEGTGDEWNSFDSSDGGMTWNSKAAIDTDNIVYSAEFPANERLQVITIDVTELLKTLPAGTTEVAFAITGEDGHQFCFASKEFGTGYEPKLLLQRDEEVHVSGVTLDQTTMTLVAGSSRKLTAEITPEDAANKAVSWSSDNGGVATVDSNGNVTAVASGLAVITVTTQDGNHQATCTVTVTALTPQPEKHTITLNPNGGSVTPETIEVEEGETTFLPTPYRAGSYRFLGWFDEDGNQVTSSTRITEDMTLTARWQYTGSTKPVDPVEPSKPTEPSEPVKVSYSDVSVGHWYYDAVSYVSEHGLMTGVGNGKFSPDGAVTRAMVWTVLARMAGENTEGGATWYSKAQAWAMRTGVSDGTNPMNSITREQLAAMLYRYEGSPAVTGNLNAYHDGNTVSDWAVDAMVWATEEGIINGINGYLKPKDGATRAQLAAMLQRYTD